MKWISIKDKLPELETDVLVARPNQYSKKIDRIIACLFDSGPEGRTWGHVYDVPRKRLSGFYWSLPAVCPLDHITHWMPLPEPPKQ